MLPLPAGARALELLRMSTRQPMQLSGRSKSTTDVCACGFCSPPLSDAASASLAARRACSFALRLRRRSRLRCFLSRLRRWAAASCSAARCSLCPPRVRSARRRAQWDAARTGGGVGGGRGGV